jgi:hypothetical protein
VLLPGLVAVRCVLSPTGLSQYMRVEIAHGLNSSVVHVATGKLTIDCEMPARILPGCPSYVSVTWHNGGYMMLC